MLRKRAWHEQESRRARGVKGLVKAVVGIGLPIVVLLAVITANTAKPPEPPPPPALAATGASVASGDTLDGEWEVGADSWVGYRILEDIPRLRGLHEAVGRTPEVQGRLRIDGSTVLAARVRADLRALASDRPWRERALRSRYLETSRYPVASFEISEPLTLLGLPAAGEPVEIAVTGDLDLHGVTRRVQAPLQARWDGERVRVAGTLEVTLADHGISPPRIPGFRFVEPDGQIELDLTFVRPQASD